MARQAQGEIRIFSTDHDSSPFCGRNGVESSSTSEIRPSDGADLGIVVAVAAMSTIGRELGADQRY